MSNGHKFNWFMVVMLGVLSACLVYLVVVNGNVEHKEPVSASASSSRGLECAFGGTIYFNTTEKRIAEFTCE